MNALYNLIAKEHNGQELDDIEKVIFWVWDDPINALNENIKLAEKAAKQYRDLKNQLEIERAVRNGIKLLDCDWCGELFPVENMFTVDACCEEHQTALMQEREPQ